MTMPAIAVVQYSGVEGDVYRVTGTLECMYDENTARIGITGLGRICIGCAEKLAAKLEGETR